MEAKACHHQNITLEEPLEKPLDPKRVRHWRSAFGVLHLQSIDRCRRRLEPIFVSFFLRVPIDRHLIHTKPTRQPINTHNPMSRSPHARPTTTPRVSPRRTGGRTLASPL